jgi:uncharacterized membrane protein (Fun14 family)
MEHFIERRATEGGGGTIKEVLKLEAVVAELFLAGSVDLQYQRVIIIDWTKLQGISKNRFTALANTITK